MEDFLHVLSPSGQFIYVSPSSQELLNWPNEELLGRNIEEFLHPEDFETFTKFFKQTLQSNNVLNHPALTQDPVLEQFYYRFKLKPNSTSIKTEETDPFGGQTDHYQLLELLGVPWYGSHPDLNLNFNQINLSPVQTNFSPTNPNNPSTSPSKSNQILFLGIARLYPGKTQTMLDSFLEIKLENEKLRQELNLLYGEIEAEDAQMLHEGSSYIFSIMLSLYVNALR